MWQWDPDQLRAWQLTRLNEQFAEILPKNQFYREKFSVDSLQLSSLDELSQLPFTTKEELVASALDSPTKISRHHTYPETDYSRVHRTSGTTGEPMMVLDTEHDWQHWSWTWQHVLEAAELTPADRVFLAFSFGPFIGFWSAHQACVDRGATVIPGGGLSSLARLEFMKQTRANVMFCTPSYALHLSEIASESGFDLRDLSIRCVIVAGEAGGSVPAVRARIENDWRSTVIDHSGATEIGPWGFGWPDRVGLHIIEPSFIAELLPMDTSPKDESPETEGSEAEGPLQELVLTSLGRLGAPVIRYRTGDAVLAQRPSEGPCRFLWLPKGVVGRTDNMVTIRGVNVFPSSIDAIVRDFADVQEYRVLITNQGQLDQIQIEAETSEATQAELTRAFNVRLGLRIPVSIVAPGCLPRSEGKSRRWHDNRKSEAI